MSKTLYQIGLLHAVLLHVLGDALPLLGHDLLDIGLDRCIDGSDRCLELVDMVVLKIGESALHTHDTVRERGASNRLTTETLILLVDVLPSATGLKLSSTHVSTASVQVTHLLPLQHHLVCLRQLRLARWDLAAIARWSRSLRTLARLRGLFAISGTLGGSALLGGLGLLGLLRRLWVRSLLWLGGLLRSCWIDCGLCALGWDKLSRDLHVLTIDWGEGGWRSLGCLLGLGCNSEGVGVRHRGR